MPSFEGDFSVTQDSINTFSLTDISTGSDPNITGRQIFNFRSDGTTLVLPTTPSGQIYIDWLIADTAITLNGILKRDYALNIRVDWFSPTPDPAGTYTKTHTVIFTDYSETFLYG